MSDEVTQQTKVPWWLAWSDRFVATLIGCAIALIAVLVMQPALKNDDGTPVSGGEEVWKATALAGVAIATAGRGFLQPPKDQTPKE